MAGESNTRELIVVSYNWPVANFGYGIAVRASLKQYLKVFSRVHFVSLSRLDFPEPQAWKGSPVDWIHVPTPIPPKWYRFLISLPRRLPAIAMRFARVRALARRTIQRVSADVRARGHRAAVVFEDGPPALLMPVVRKELPGAPVALRSHNVLAKAFGGFGRTGWLPERLSWRVELAKTRRLERLVCSSADRLWPISRADADEYLRRYGVRAHGVVGTSLEASHYAQVQPGSPLKVVHIGSADLRKGMGLTEFIQRAWPTIVSRVPRARLILAGRGTQRFADPGRRIEALGFVADDRTLLEQGLIFVNPQRFGSGVKLKSIVAMLAGKALVASPTGIEGVEGTDGKDFFVSADLDAMADRVVDLLADPELARDTGQNARTLAADRYSEQHLSKTVLPLLEEMGSGLVSTL